MSNLKSIKNLYKSNKNFIFELWKNGKIYVVLQIMIIIFGGYVTYIEVVSPKKFLDTIISKSDLLCATLYIIYWILIEIFYFIISTLISIYKSYTMSKPILKVKIKTILNLKELYMNYYENPETQNKISRAISYAENGGKNLFDFLLGIISTIVSFFSISYVSVQFDWWIIALILCVFIVKTLANNKIKKNNHKFNRERSTRSRQLGYYSTLLTYKENIPEATVYNTFNIFIKKYKEIFLRDRDLLKQHSMNQLFYQIIDSSSYRIFQIFSYFFIGYRIINNLSTIGDYTLFFSLIGNIYLILNKIETIYSDLFTQLLEVDNYDEFVNEEENRRNCSGREIEEIDKIVFNNVSYKYPGQNCNAIDNCSFTINKGDKITIIGYNGAGKSTLIKMLTGLYRCCSGSISINDRDISEYNCNSLFNQIGFVFQNYNVYALDVAENIKLDEINETDKDRINQCLKEIGLFDKISSYKKGLDSEVTRLFDEDGIDFSGGERQKISIARAIYKNASLILLDEPSSALDVVSEQKILKNIIKQENEKIVITVSHRLSGICDSDKVMFMKDGKIIALDDHSKLISENEEYKHFFNSQNLKMDKTN